MFCHFVATGKTLRQRLSDAIRAEIRALGAKKLGCPVGDIDRQLEHLGGRFFDADFPVRRACDEHARRLLADFPALSDHHDDLAELVRRNLRTPSFLVRYFPVGHGTLDAEAMGQALETKDASGLTLREVLRQFLTFLAERCGADERAGYIEAVRRIQTGSHFGRRADAEYEADELQGATAEGLVPNVRLVNGATRQVTRQRLMLTFNTPFYPEVLVASSVMAEGVDLHRHCRHVLHHDLRWNPSDLEQRTGRVDRIGAKAEQCRRPVQVDVPFVAQTQDEKMYRVVTDCERWFGVLMGEEYAVDARSTEAIAARVPLPTSAAGELAFQLGVDADR